MNTFIADKLLDNLREELSAAFKVIDRLRDNGYTNNYRMANDNIVCIENNRYYKSSDFQVDEIYRFFDESGVIDNFFLYALKDPWEGTKGLLITNVYS